MSDFFFNQHFLEDTDPLWRKHAERDFRKWKPEEFENWREFFIVSDKS